MATADVISIVDQTLLHFDSAGAFTKTDTGTIAAAKPATAADGVSAATATPTLQVEMDRFPLEDSAFVKLQVYLLAALKLPKDNTAFEQEYPPYLFAPYAEKDKETPLLYGFMRDTLTTIHKHCFDFKAGPLNSMVILASQIASFSLEASKQASTIAKNFDVILTPGASMSDDTVRAAADSISNAMEELAGPSKLARDKCNETFKALSAFKTTTEVDKIALQKVATRSHAVLPSTEKLNAEMRAIAEKAYHTLNELKHTEDQLFTRIENKSGSKWYHHLPYAGLGLVIADTVDRFAAEQTVRFAASSYETVFKSASEELRTIIMFRGVCKQLLDSIDTVNEAIKEAADAVQGMMNAFANLETGFNGIAGQLDAAKGKVVGEVARRRISAQNDFEKAKNNWRKVRDLASRFMEKGLLLEKNVNDLPADRSPDPYLNIVSVNWGGVDVSPYAKVLFNYGDSIRIRTVQPGFHESWKGVHKSISVLHTLGEGGEERLFTCQEYSGPSWVHVLEPKYKVGEQPLQGAELSKISPLKAPSNCPIEILAIVWGAKEIRTQSVWDYCYKMVNNANENVYWTNYAMGGPDPWPNNPKSGVIYYRKKGEKEIRQCTGREQGTTAFISI